MVIEKNECVCDSHYVTLTEAASWYCDIHGFVEYSPTAELYDGPRRGKRIPF